MSIRLTVSVANRLNNKSIILYLIVNKVVYLILCVTRNLIWWTSDLWCHVNWLCWFAIINVHLPLTTFSLCSLYSNCWQIHYNPWMFMSLWDAEMARFPFWLPSLMLQALVLNCDLKSCFIVTKVDWTLNKTKYTQFWKIW